MNDVGEVVVWTARWVGLGAWGIGMIMSFSRWCVTVW